MGSDRAGADAPACVLWRRLDAPGHDACRLERTPAGWRLDGAAVFLRDGEPARLDYRVECDRGFGAPRALVRGWVGARALELRLERGPSGAWSLNGEPASELETCADLDLGFTPATNLLALRRLALAPGQAAQAPAAWLDEPDGRLALLPQRYERRSATTYWYESPSTGYSGLLEVDATGFVSRYPGLWEREKGAPAA